MSDTENQAENSIAYQRREIAGSCTRNSIGLVGACTNEARSGADVNRRCFQTFIAAGDHRFDAAAVYDVSCGPRDVADGFQFRWEMRRLEIAAVSAIENPGGIS